MTQALREEAGCAVRASWTERLKGAFRIGLAAGVAAIFLALVGAFGTGGHSVAFRLAYWLSIILIGTALSYGVSALVGRLVDRRARPWLGGVIVAIVLGGLLTGLLAAFWSIFLSGWMPLSVLPGLYAQVLIITAAMTAYITAVERWPRSGKATADDGVAPARFMDRLPHRLRDAELLAVTADDHYLKVHTDGGEAMILLRLSDAIAELAGMDGARTHRSWWVARPAVADIERSDRRVTLVLKTGVRAPVSRSHASALRQLGWF